MIDIRGKKISNVGWAGPLLWLVTDSGWSIHFYDGKISLNGQLVSEGENLSLQLNGQLISKVSINSSKFSIEFGLDKRLSVSSETHETARAFKKGSGRSHHVYQNGIFSQEVE